MARGGRGKVRTRRVGAVGASVLALIVGACGGGGERADPIPTPSSTVATTPAPIATSTPSPIPTPEVFERWTRTGPEGGTVHVLAVDPFDPTVVYAAAAGGLFKSSDRGETWEFRSDGIRDERGLLPEGGVISVAIDPVNSAVLYAGTEAGLFQSLDGGHSWHPQGSGLVTINGGPVRVSGIAIDRTSSSTIFATGQPAGVFKSTDAGESWTLLAVADLPRELSFTAVAIRPDAPNVVLAGPSYAGIFRTDDGGLTWRQIRSGGTRDLSFHSFVFDPRDPRVVYAGAFEGVFVSIDGGSVWRGLNEGLPAGDAVLAPNSALLLDPIQPGRLWAGTTSGVYAFDPELERWTAFSPESLDVPVEALAAASDGTIYAGTYGRGVFAKRPDADSWRAIRRGFAGTSIHAIAIDFAAPHTLVVGGEGGVHRSDDAGGTWTATHDDLFARGTVVGLGMGPDEPRRVWAVVPYEGLFVSEDGGETWSESTLDVRIGAPYSVAGIAVHPTDPNRIVVASGLVYVSRDGGRSWSTSSVRTENYTCVGVKAVAIDPSDPSVVFVADGFGVSKSTDGGETFPPIGCGIDASDVPATVAIDPRDPSIVYASTYRGLMKSEDGGEVWTDENVGLEGVQIHSLAIDADAPSTLYVGTDRGVFRSDDAGETFSPMNEGLLAAPIYALAVVPGGDTILAGSSGGAVQQFRLRPPDR